MKFFMLLIVLAFASKKENDAFGSVANSGEKIMKNAVDNSIVVKIEELDDEAAKYGSEYQKKMLQEQGVTDERLEELITTRGLCVFDVDGVVTAISSDAQPGSDFQEDSDRVFADQSLKSQCIDWAHVEFKQNGRIFMFSKHAKDYANWCKESNFEIAFSTKGNWDGMDGEGGKDNRGEELYNFSASDETCSEKKEFLVKNFIGTNDGRHECFRATKDKGTPSYCQFGRGGGVTKKDHLRIILQQFNVNHGRNPDIIHFFDDAHMNRQHICEYIESSVTDVKCYTSLEPREKSSDMGNNKGMETFTQLGETLKVFDKVCKNNDKDFKIPQKIFDYMEKSGCAEIRKGGSAHFSWREKKKKLHKDVKIEKEEKEMTLLQKKRLRLQYLNKEVEEMYDEEEFDSDEEALEIYGQKPSFNTRASIQDTQILLEECAFESNRYEEYVKNTNIEFNEQKEKFKNYNDAHKKLLDATNFDDAMLHFAEMMETIPEPKVGINITPPDLELDNPNWNWLHIPHERFLKDVQDNILSFFQEHPDEYFYLYIGGVEKSFTWVNSIAFSNQKMKAYMSQICGFYRRTLPLQRKLVVRAKHECTNNSIEKRLILLDDMTYSGNQMFQTIKVIKKFFHEQKKQHFIYILYPYCTNLAFGRIKHGTEKAVSADFTTTEADVMRVFGGYSIHCKYTFRNGNFNQGRTRYKNTIEIFDKDKFKFMVHEKANSEVVKKARKNRVIIEANPNDIQGTVTIFFDHKIHDFFNPYKMSKSPYKEKTYARL